MFVFMFQTLLASVVFIVGILETAGTLADIQYSGGVLHVLRQPQLVVTALH